MIINFIKKYFTQSKNYNDNDNILSFKLDKNNFPSFNIIVNDNSSDAAQKLALFIHYLNSGFLKQDIFDILLIKSHENLDTKNFLKDVIFYWMTYSKNYNNEPIVSPTDFLKKR